MDKFKKIGKGVLTAAFVLAAGLGIAGLGVGSAALAEHYGWGTDIDGATKALKEAGLTPKEVGGKAWFECGKLYYATKYSAVDKGGNPVKGAVCTQPFSNHSAIHRK